MGQLVVMLSVPVEQSPAQEQDMQAEVGGPSVCSAAGSLSETVHELQLFSVDRSGE